MPPPTLLKQVLDKLVVVAISDLVLVEGLLLRYCYCAILLGIGFLGVLLAIKLQGFFALIDSEALSDDEALVDSERYPVLFVQDPMDEAHHLFLYLGQGPVISKAVEEGCSQYRLSLWQVLNAHVLT